MKRKYTDKQRQASLPLMEAVAISTGNKSKIKKDFTPAEAKKILATIKGGKDKQVENSDNKKELIERREKIIKLKKAVRELERTNRSRLILFPSFSRESDTTEWYKMGNFSALYYVYRMADRMGRTAKVQKDKDRFAKMDYIASIKGIEGFIAQAMELKEFDCYETGLDGMYILYLKKPLSDEEYSVLTRTESARREMMHSVLKPKRADAKVYQVILMLSRQLLPRTGALTRGPYGEIGAEMSRQVHGLMCAYFMMSNGRMDLDEAKDAMLDAMEWLQSGIALLGEIDAWNFDKATSVGENVNHLRAMVEEWGHESGI